MHLYHLGVAVLRAGLVAARRSTAGADHAHCALAEDQSVAASSHHHRVGWEALDLHRTHVLGDDADTLLVVNYRPEEFPELVFCDLAFGLVATDLLVQRVEKLLARRRAREECPFEQ